MPDESRVDVSARGFWKWCTALSTEEKEKKDKYLQPCLERRRSFTPTVYSADRIPGTEAVAELRRLALLLSNKLKQEYLEMCSFVRVRISLVIVRSITLLLRGARDKEAYICQRPDMVDGAVPELIVSWKS